VSIVPPYVLDALERHPSDRVRRAARSTRSTVLQRPDRAPSSAARAAQGRRPRQRLVYDGRCGKSLPGKLVRLEGQPKSNDLDVNRAYDMAGRTLEFYADVLGRDSIDDCGMAISSTVHFGERYQNAFWNGAQMVYGDGDGEAFESFTTCLEITAHELAHGVTHFSADAIRSHPICVTMWRMRPRRRSCTSNSGIPNHAFYLFAKALGGYAWEIGGRVWYDALRSGLDRRCGFRSFAGATAEAARARGVRVVDAVRQAWTDVGIIAL